MSYMLRDEIPAAAHKELEAYPELLRALLHYRGIRTRQEAHEFLNPSYLTGLHDPFLLKGMDKAVARILDAVDRTERILIYSDYDADGIPAAVILSDFFKLIGYENYEVYIPHRHNEGFGLHLEAIDTFKDRIKLMITLDCGITDCEEVDHARREGIDVIITDHHLPGETLPQAYAIVNPKQPGCEYPFDMLCGAGVGFKLIQALVQALKSGGPNRVSIKEGHEKWLLDMVGLATLSDMVPLKGENRVLAKYGLTVLRKTRRAGLQKLLAKMKINPAYLSEDDIGFMITPRINAASRMGIPLDAYRLLSATDEGEAGALAAHLDAINNERKGLVAALSKEIQHLLKDRSDHYEQVPVIVMGNPNWRPAILGLAANSIVEEYRKPVFLWGREDGKHIKGSCRSYGAASVVKVMDAARHAFLDFGGHTMSGGFSVSPDNIHTLEDALVKAYESLYPGSAAAVPEATVTIDRKLTFDDVHGKTFDMIDQLSPFGMDNEKPVFLFEKALVKNVKIFGKTKEHLELEFANSKNRPVRAISFFSKPEDFKRVPEAGKHVDLIATLEKSYFMNRPEVRLRIIDVV